MTLVSRKKSYNSNDSDLYQTPIYVTEMILNRLEVSDNALFYEPANGLGAISKVIKSYGYRCDTSDIRDGIDFLRIKNTPKYDVVMTNPPYKYAQEFVEKSLKQVVNGGKVVMLLRLSFLESAKRYRFFRDSGLKNVYVSCRRITMYPENGDKPKNSGTLAFAWYEWEKGYDGEPMLNWFNE